VPVLLRVAIALSQLLLQVLMLYMPGEIAMALG
jgi:hypothetical protein